MLGRINPGETVGENRERAPSRGERATRRGGIDAARQARDNPHTDPRQRGCKPLGDAQSVRRTLARADDGHGQFVTWLICTFEIEQSRRIGNVAQRRRIAVVSARHGGHTQASTVLQFGLGIEFPTRSGDPIGEFLSHARHAAQAGNRGVERPAGRAEALQKRPAEERADSGHHRQADEVAQRGVRGRIGYRIRQRDAHWFLSRARCYKSRSTARMSSSLGRSVSSTWPTACGRTNRVLPFWFFLSRLMASRSASRSSPGAVVGS